MSHSGNPTYQADAMSNISIVGTGFKILREVNFIGGPTNTEAEFLDGPYCVAIKNVCASDVNIQARSVIGDNLSIGLGGVYNKALTDSYISLSYGDIVYGLFDKVAIEEPDSGTTNIQLIKGGE
jgi:hypothetical protein